MAIHLEITDRGGFREQTLEQDSFWLGGDESCAVGLDIPDCQGRVLEVRLEEDQLTARIEPGLPFPVRSASGNLGTRFQTIIGGDILNVGPALVKLRCLSVGVQAGDGEDLDLDSMRDPGAPVGTWYQTFMEVADHLEGLSDSQRMIRTALEAVLQASDADRAHLLRSEECEGERRAYFLSGEGDETPFRVSNSLINRVLETGRVLHVPVASADPVASQFLSIRREGISSTIALPLMAYGRNLGVLYADCVRDGAVLGAEDLQRVAFIGRMLASALGNRDLVTDLIKVEPAGAAAEHPALKTSSPSCRDLVERIKLYAPTDYTLLLRGETGSGKEVIARALHDLSRRKGGPFVPVNCAAIPGQLMESMLFGHEKGAFTGATESRPGHFEEAHGGTIFLDEIGDMALDLQAKILRVLQDRVVTPVGSRRQTRVDVRILAATHQDLEQMTAERRFREDLYYRLRELELRLPSLRDRKEDILMLCGRFLEEAARELGFANVPELATETLDNLQQRTWRGNIRELRHVMKGAALRAGGAPIRVSHLDPSPVMEAGSFASRQGVDSELPWKDRLEAQELAALRETLERSSGNLTKAAQLFGVPRTTYREKLVKSGLLEKPGGKN